MTMYLYNKEIFYLLEMFSLLNIYRLILYLTIWMIRFKIDQLKPTNKNWNKTADHFPGGVIWEALSFIFHSFRRISRLWNTTDHLLINSGFWSFLIKPNQTGLTINLVDYLAVNYFFYKNTQYIVFFFIFLN